MELGEVKEGTLDAALKCINISEEWDVRSFARFSRVYMTCFVYPRNHSLNSVNMTGTTEV
jgi:hypothetical protein